MFRNHIYGIIYNLFFISILLFLRTPDAIKASETCNEKRLSNISATFGSIHIVAISPNDEDIALAVNQKVFLLNVKSSNINEVFSGDYVNDVRFSGDGRFIGISSGNDTGFYDLLKHKYFRTIKQCHGDFVVSVFFSHNNRYFIVSYGNPNPEVDNFKKVELVISIFDTENGKNIFKERCPRNSWSDDANIISRDGIDTLVYISYNFIYYYDISNRKLISQKRISESIANIFDIESIFLDNNKILFIERKLISANKKPWYDYYLCIKGNKDSPGKELIKIKNYSIRRPKRDKEGRLICLYAKVNKKIETAHY